MVHSNAVVIDVGTSRADYKHERRDGGYRTVGDVSADAYPYCAAYTPVPGGVCDALFSVRSVLLPRPGVQVGPVTVAMLAQYADGRAVRCVIRSRSVPYAC